MGAKKAEQSQKGTVVITIKHGSSTARVFVVAFRGTVTEQDWMGNLGAIRNEAAFSEFAIDVHSGWHGLLSNEQQVEEMEKALSDEARSGIDCVLFCGHSMGGALAQIAALKLYQRF